MGQKVNPIVFRLGLTKTWKNKHSEKTNEEFKNYNFKNLQIFNYISQNLKKKGLKLHDYSVNYNKRGIDVYISYFIDLQNFKNSIKKQPFSLYVENNNKILAFDNKTLNLFNNNQFEYNKDQSYCFKLAKGLALYFKKKKTYKSFFFCVNRKKFLYLFDKQKLKKSLSGLRRYQNAPFFKKGIELMINTTYIKEFSHILADYISVQLKVNKRPNFFIYFINNGLKSFVENSGTVKGIKIKITGRINGRPRARKKILKIGDVPVFSLTHKLDYCEKVSQGSNGSLGIKIWVVKC